MMRCIHCDTELIAPVRSEYWSDKHACHIWLCPKCCACFSSVVSFRALELASRMAGRHWGNNLRQMPAAPVAPTSSPTRPAPHARFGERECSPVGDLLKRRSSTPVRCGRGRWNKILCSRTDQGGGKPRGGIWSSK